jgi:hypothetical protein
LGVSWALESVMLAQSPGARPRRAASAGAALVADASSPMAPGESKPPLAQREKAYRLVGRVVPAPHVCTVTLCSALAW